MKINHLLIHLQHNIDSFSIKPRHIEEITRLLPGTFITVAVNNTDFVDRLAEADSVMTWNFKAEWYRLAPRLKSVFTPAAGHDWVATDPSGRVRTFYGNFHGRIMRESLLAMMLHFSRQIGRSVDDQKNRFWGRSGYNDCRAISSQRIMIIGFGALGQSMAEILKAFGADICAVKRDTSGVVNHPNIDRLIAFDQLPEELPHADQVVFVMPGGAKTDRIFTARHFKALKPGAYLYNLGRGNCYAEEDLIDALKSGRLAGAGLDVFAEEPLSPASPLWGLPNVLITPHSSAISQEYIDLFIGEWAEKIQMLQF